MIKTVTGLLFSFLMLFQSAVFAAEKAKLILMPVQGAGITDSDKVNYRTSLQKGLSDKYTVFSGAEVEKRLKKYSAKTCDATECLQEVAIDFQGELIGRLVVTKQPEGYFLAIEVKNIFTDEIVETDNILCEGCNTFAVMRKLQGLGKPATVPVRDSVIAISTNPIVKDAKIIVDDQMKGRAPGEIRMKAGEHTIRIESESHTGEREIIVKQGVDQRIAINLEEIKEPEGELIVRTIPLLPNADVYVDGEVLGKVGGTIVLPAGDHSVKVETDKYYGLRNIVIKEDEREQVFLALGAAKPKGVSASEAAAITTAAAEEDDGWWSWWYLLLLAAAVPGEETPPNPGTGDVTVSW